MGYVGFVKFIVKITAICGKKPKIVLLKSEKDIAVGKKKWFSLSILSHLFGKTVEKPL